MFGLRLVTKAEISLYVGTISDLRSEKKHLQELVEHERVRAEAMLNLLLMKTQQAAITPNDTMTMKQQEEFEQRTGDMLDIYGDGKVQTQDELLKELQS